MAKQIQLSDLLPKFVSQFDPKIQATIVYEAEFLSQRLPPTEPPPRRGEKFKHQIFISRFMLNNDVLFLYHDPGTGKTCVFGALGEIHSVLRNRDGNRKKVLFLTKSDTLRNEARQQMACRCTDGKYIPNSITRAIDPITGAAQQKAAVTRELNKYYKFITYEIMAKSLMKKYPDDDEGNARMAQDYADYLIFIDEVHNLISATDTTGNDSTLVPDPDVKSPVPDLDAGETVGDDAESEEVTGKSFQGKITKEEIYKQLHRLMHNAKRGKLMISSGTPMINREDEIGPIMNLILPIDKQIPSNFDFLNGDLTPYVSNRVSYVRAMNIGAVPEEAGVDITQYYYATDRLAGTRRDQLSEIKVRVWEGKMDNFQNEVYQYAAQTAPTSTLDSEDAAEAGAELKGSEDSPGAEIDEELPRSSVGFSTALRQAANFVFPDGSWGMRGFNKYVESKGSDNYIARPDLKVELGRNRLNNLSCKFYQVCKIISEAKQGCDFVYGEYVKASGVILLGLALEEWGFTKFTETTSVFENIGGGTRPYCASTSSVGRRLRGNFRPSGPGGAAKRYCILLRETPKARVAAMMEAFNSPENANGALISVFITSRLGREGINVYNCLRGHILDGQWTPSSIFQASMRWIRATSQNALLALEEERLTQRKTALQNEAKQLRDRGEVKLAELKETEAKAVDPQKARLELKIYKHAAIPIADQKNPTNISDRKDLREEIVAGPDVIVTTVDYGIDVKLYLIAAVKDRKIKRTERKLKINAVDCWLNYYRNVRSGDVPGSAACDYTDCIYKCTTPLPNPADTKVDYNNENLLYSERLIKRVIADIITLFSTQYFTLTLEELYNKLPSYIPEMVSRFRAYFILQALDNIINTPRIIRNRNGYNCQVFEHGDIYYLSTGTVGDYPGSYYDHSIIGLRTETLAEIVTQQRQPVQMTLIDKVMNTDPAAMSGAEFRQLISSIDFENKSQLLEQTVIAWINKDPRPVVTTLLAGFRPYIFTIHKPTNEIRASLETHAGKGKKKDKTISHRPNKVNPLALVESKTPRNTRESEMEQARELDQETQPLIYVHTYLAQPPSERRYNMVAMYRNPTGQLRVMEDVKEGWYNVSPDEAQIYSTAVQLEILKMLEPYEAKRVYGFMFGPGPMVVRDVTADTGKAINGRNTARGGACVNRLWGDIVNLLWNAQVPAPIDAKILEMDEKDLRQVLSTANSRGSLTEATREQVGDWPLERLRYYYAWIKSNKTKPSLCVELENFLRRNKAIIDLPYH